MSNAAVCERCAHDVEIPAGYKRAKIRCDHCGWMCEVSGARPVPEPQPQAKKAAAPAPVRTPAPKAPKLKPVPGEEEPGGTFGIATSQTVHCPRCQMVLSAATDACGGCGYDPRLSKKTTFEPLTRQWHAGWSLAVRVQVFLASEAFGFLMAVLATLLGEPVLALIMFTIFTGLTAYLLGTFNRVQLTRNERGRITLTDTWRICFISKPPAKLRLSEYDGIATGKESDADMWSWVICVILLGFGLVPGGIFWYLAIYQDKFYVTLTRDHGALAYNLYRGPNEDRTMEMAETMRELIFTPEG
jgi:hypothetical protein